MKLLQINKLYYPHIGGVENVARMIAEGAVSFGWDSEVLVCREGDQKPDEIIGGAHIIRAQSWGKFFSLPLSLDFFRIFRHRGGLADILLFHEPYPWGALAYFLFRPRGRVIVFYHSDIVRQKIAKWFFYPFLLFLLRRAEKILVASRGLAESSPVLQKFNNKIAIVPLGVNYSEFEPDAGTMAAGAAIVKKYGPFILSIGRLVYYKGYEYLIDAMKTAKNSLIIIGAGPEQKKLAEQIKNNNLSDRVFLLGRIDDLRPYLLSCKFFVFPSVANSEAFGLVQAEAMFFSRPVINTDLPTGVPEVSRHLESGLTVPVMDASALSQAINLLWNDPELYAKLSAGAKERSKLYSRENFWARIKKELS